MDHPEISGSGLGRFEFLMMNNPVRRWLQRRVEFAAFKRFLRRRGIDPTGKVIMDAGCGSGYGAALILRDLKPARLIAFDLMPAQIALARRRRLGIDFSVGDATRMEQPDATCDAVFDFGILHHIPAWRQALSEAARVLKPGGVLLAEEPHYRFTWDELEAALAEAGLVRLEKNASCSV